MSGFEPGEGWREVTAQGYVEASATTITLREDGTPDRWWVRVEPVPPLPVAPWTVIRVVLKRPRRVPLEWTLHEGGLWHARLGYYRGADDLADLISDFEVLAEPGDWHFSDEEFHAALDVKAETVRRETAKAVVAHVREVFNDTRDGRLSLTETLAVVAREFEVQS